MMDVKVIGIKLNIKKWLPFMLIIVVVFMSVTGCNSYTADKKKESVNNKDTSTPVIIEHENSSEKQEGEVSEKNLSEGSTETVVIEKNKATSVEIKAQAEIIESWTWERDDNVTLSLIHIYRYFFKKAQRLSKLSFVMELLFKVS